MLRDIIGDFLLIQKFKYLFFHFNFHLIFIVVSRAFKKWC